MADHLPALGPPDDHGCWLPFYDSGIEGWRKVGDHDWRLLEAIPSYRRDPFGGPGSMAPSLLRFYCTRCRTVVTDEVVREEVVASG